jgi:hypothetical protein
MALCEEQVPGIARRKSRPEEGSIHATIVANRSTRLYVHPLQWTGQHLELLSSILHPPPSSPGCESGNTAVQMQEDLVLHGLIWGRCLYAAANINRWRDLRIREKKLRMVVTYLCKAATGLQVQRFTSCAPSLTLWNRAVTNDFYSDFLRFRYASRTAAYLNVPFHFCLNNQRPDQRCAWAYLERSWCWDQRYNFYSYRKKRPYRYAMQACRDADRYPFDPFCLAVLISLAQTARRAAGGVEPLKVFFLWLRWPWIANDVFTGLPLYPTASTRSG